MGRIQDKLQRFLSRNNDDDDHHNDDASDSDDDEGFFQNLKNKFEHKKQKKKELEGKLNKIKKFAEFCKKHEIVDKAKRLVKGFKEG